MTAPAAVSRRVRRILRKFDTWTVLKTSLVLSALAALGLVLLAVVFWAVVSRLGLAGALDSAARRVALIAPEESLFKTGDEYLRGAVMLAGAWMMAAAGLSTVGAVLYNLVAELTGGVEFTVFEEVPAAGAAGPGENGADAARGW